MNILNTFHTKYLLMEHCCNFVYLGAWVKIQSMICFQFWGVLVDGLWNTGVP